MRKLSPIQIFGIIVVIFGLTAVVQIVLKRLTITADGVANTNDVKELMRSTSAIFSEKAQFKGAYSWKYTKDFSHKWGEDTVELPKDQGWIQPPGTPSVGFSYLLAFMATRWDTYRVKAQVVADALSQTQLSSGGWAYRVAQDSALAQKYHYRTDVEKGDVDPKKRNNRSSYDDDTTQAALRFLIRYDAYLQELNVKPTVQTLWSRQNYHNYEKEIDYGLTKLIEAQRANGGWPQGYYGKSLPEGISYPDKSASYPKTWPLKDANESKKWPGTPREIWEHYYTVNDNLVYQNIKTLLLAYNTSGNPAYLNAAKKAGDFLLKAQLPSDAQPVWSQYYNTDMQPVWARKGEPPAAVSMESGSSVIALLDLYGETFDQRYLDAAGKAVDWFNKNRLPDGTWARFYELQTNKPLYMTSNYELTYSRNDLPATYSYYGTYSSITSAITYYNNVKQNPTEYFKNKTRPRTKEENAQLAARLSPDIQSLLNQKSKAAYPWIDQDGFIYTKTFNKNITVLSKYLLYLQNKDFPSTL